MGELIMNKENQLTDEEIVKSFEEMYVLGRFRAKTIEKTLALIYRLQDEKKEYETLFDIYNERKYRKMFNEEWKKEYQKELDKQGEGVIAGFPDGDYVYRRYFEQKAEIERLKDEKEEIRLFNLALQNGEVDMRIESEMAKSFYNSIIQVFEQNGGKNFFTTTIDIEGKNGRYAFTIEKVGGQTVAEKLADQKAEIERLTEDCESADAVLEAQTHLIDLIKKDKAELQKQVDELKANNEHLDSENTRLVCEMDKLLDDGWDIMDEEADAWYKKGGKDTAKEIFDWLKSEVIMTEIPHGGELSEEDVEAVMWWQIEEHFKKRYGVEGQNG